MTVISLGNVIWAKFDLNISQQKHTALLYNQTRVLFAILLQYIN